MARRQLRKKNKNPLIVLCVEGEKNSSEYSYFRHYTNRNLRIKFSTGGNTDPKGMLEDLIKYINNEDIISEDNCRIFLVLDTDLSDKRIKEIKEIEQKCKENNIEIITSSPTFEIWYLMHFRDNKLKFSTSKDVKKELERVNGSYSEKMDMYPLIKDLTIKAKSTAQSIEQIVARNNEELLESNPHTSIYKVLEAIDEYNNLNK